MEKITVVKIGGNVIDDPAVLKRFIADFAAMPGPKILVHGGGKEISALLERLRNACTSFRILGSYPTGPQLDRMSLSGDDASDEQGM